MKGRILVSVDFQDASLAALALARQLGEKLDLEVVLLHVYVFPVVAYPGFVPIAMPAYSEEIAAAAKRALEALAKENGGLRMLICSGDPASEILRTVDEIQPALVVLGTHGRRGLARAILGSVAEKVVRGSSAPVLTVHAGESRAS